MGKSGQRSYRALDQQLVGTVDNNDAEKSEIENASPLTFDDYCGIVLEIFLDTKYRGVGPRQLYDEWQFFDASDLKARFHTVLFFDVTACIVIAFYVSSSNTRWWCAAFVILLAALNIGIYRFVRSRFKSDAH